MMTLDEPQVLEMNDTPNMNDEVWTPWRACWPQPMGTRIWYCLHRFAGIDCRSRYTQPPRRKKLFRWE